MRKVYLLFTVFLLIIFYTACKNVETSVSDSLEIVSVSEMIENQTELSINSIQTGWITKQVLDGNDGKIHYSYYLPESYDEKQLYPMIVIMPGYDMM